MLGAAHYTERETIRIVSPLCPVQSHHIIFAKRQALLKLILALTMWRMHVAVCLRQQTHHTGGVGWVEEFTCVYSIVSVFQFAVNIPTFLIILQYAHINDKNRT